MRRNTFHCNPIMASHVKNKCWPIFYFITEYKHSENYKDTVFSALLS